jgi:uncharacterized protein YdhG (YjbR/CyaY superfamily)
MNTDILNAYQECGRIVFAYKNNFACDSLQLNSNAKLNGLDKIELIQAILSNNGNNIVFKSPKNEYLKTANQLLEIACAATCSRVFFENEGNINVDIEIDIPANDLKQIETIEKFLKTYDETYSNNLLNNTFVQIFSQLKKEEIWKPIENLVLHVINADELTINRFEIEDALMQAGFTIERKKVNSGFEFNLSEAETPKKQTSEIPLAEKSELDEALVKFLYTVKTDWQEQEILVAVTYLKKLFSKFG